MVGSDNSSVSRRQAPRGQSVGRGRQGDGTDGEGVEATLRRVVAGCGAALVAIALWHVAAETSLGALAAVVGSETGQWAVVVAFGCALILAARLTGPVGHRP